jgi:cytochrome c biogenesis protein CcmG, thiol:disulfide interchange protein DsbE
VQIASAARRIHAGRWLVFGLVVAFLALLAYGLLSKGTDDRIDEALASGRPVAAPGFSLEVLARGELPPALQRSAGASLTGDRLSLARLRRTPVVLNLWASWCTPCRDEAGRLERAWRTLGPKSVLFLGLDIQDLRENARDFIGKYGVTYPSVREPQRDVADDYGATGIPETYFIDRRGRVVAHARGPVTTAQLRQGLVAARTARVALIR